MLTFVLFLISFWVMWQMHTDRIKHIETLLYCVAGIFGFSLISSLPISYMLDDIDHMHYAAQITNFSEALKWFFTPHNEHVIPILKFFYLVSFKFFWLDPLFFHILIILMCVAALIVLYRLIFLLTQSESAAFLAVSLFAAVNLYDTCLFIPGDSHIFFCLVFFLLLFYAQFQYAETLKRKWIILAVLSCVLMPSTFALGLTSVVFALLFDWLCLPQKTRKDNKIKTWILITTGWAMGLIPYLISFKTILFSPHYKDLHMDSAIDVMNIQGGLHYLLFEYIPKNLIPQFLVNDYALSWLLIGFVVFLAALNFKTLPWKKILFFLIFGLSHNAIIYTFRIAWGPNYLGYARYDVFPAFGLTMIAILIISHALSFRERLKEKTPQLLIMCLCCLFLTSIAAANRFQRAEQLSLESNATLQKFFIDFKNNFQDFLKDHPQIAEINLKNNKILIQSLPSFKNKLGNPMMITRYPRTIEFYAELLLPKDIQKKIRWASASDPIFLEYMKNHKSYNYFYDMFK